MSPAATCTATLAFAATKPALQPSVPPGATSPTPTVALRVPERAPLTVRGVAVSSGTPVTVTLGAGLAPRVVTPESGAAGDLSGCSVSLSADASLLAVGAYREGSSATGLGGDQLHAAAADPRALHVH